MLTYLVTCLVAASYFTLLLCVLLQIDNERGKDSVTPLFLVFIAFLSLSYFIDLFRILRFTTWRCWVWRKFYWWWWCGYWVVYPWPKRETTVTYPPDTWQWRPPVWSFITRVRIVLRLVQGKTCWWWGLQAASYYMCGIQHCRKVGSWLYLVSKNNLSISTRTFKSW